MMSIRCNRSVTVIISRPLDKVWKQGQALGSKKCAGCSREPWRSSANPPSNKSSSGVIWNGKPGNSCKHHAQPTPRKKCAAVSKNSVTICSPSWITRRSMPPITWLNANCGQQSLPAKYPVATKPPKELTHGKSSPAWPPPVPRKANHSPISSANQPLWAMHAKHIPLPDSNAVVYFFDLERFKLIRGLSRHWFLHIGFCIIANKSLSCAATEFLEPL